LTLIKFQAKDIHLLLVKLPKCTIESYTLVKRDGLFSLQTLLCKGGLLHVTLACNSAKIV